MAIAQPDLTGDNPPSGSKSGVPGGATTTPGGSVSIPASPVAAAQPTSPKSLLQQTWRPGSFLNLHLRLLNPKMAPQVSQELDQAIQFTYNNTANLQVQIASRQAGVATVTGSQLAIPTGLSKVKNCSGSIDNGSTAHNFWVSVVPSATPGAVDIFVWQPTAAGNNTPTAGTTAVKVRWIADGTF